jgi:hypothetical protein
LGSPTLKLTHVGIPRTKAKNGRISEGSITFRRSAGSLSKTKSTPIVIALTSIKILHRQTASEKPSESTVLKA